MMDTILENKIPVIQTQRLKLRPFTLADAKDVQRMAGSFKIAQMTATIPHPYPDGAAETWIASHAPRFANGDSAEWALEDLKTGKLIGCIGYGINKNHKKSEVGYWIGEEYWGHGYCTEALKATADFCFKYFDLNKIQSRHLAINPASGKVMVKAGMTQEGFLRQDMFRNGEFQDMVVYGWLRTEWEKR